MARTISAMRDADIDARRLAVTALFSSCWVQIAQGAPLGEVLRNSTNTLRRMLVADGLRIWSRTSPNASFDLLVESVSKARRNGEEYRTNEDAGRLLQLAETHRSDPNGSPPSSVIHDSENGDTCLPIILSDEIAGLIAVRLRTPADAEAILLLEAFADGVGSVLLFQQQQSDFQRTQLQLRQFLRFAPMPIIELDAEHRVASWNPAATRRFGWHDSDVRGRMPPMLPTSSWPEFERLQATALSKRTVTSCDLVCQARDASPIRMQAVVAPHGENTERGVMTFWLDQSLREAVRRDQSLQQEYRSIVADFQSLEIQGPELLRLLGPRLAATAGEIWQQKPTGWRRVCGWAVPHASLSDLRQSLCTSSGLIDADALKQISRQGLAYLAVRDAASQSLLQRAKVRLHHQNSLLIHAGSGGAETLLLFWGAGIEQPNEATASLLEDLRLNLSLLLERQHLTDKLAISQRLLDQCQRFDTIGLLAGGVAHDFNNLLTAILGNVELAITGLEEADPRKLMLDDVREAGIRGAALTRQLLGLARPLTRETGVLDLNESIKQIERLIRSILGDQIEYERALASENLQSRIGNFDFQQLLLNLVVNARDAMSGGGRLRIETRATILPGNEGRMMIGAPPGRYCVLTISDTGCGMDPQTLARAFEPLFTTKAHGQGSGLGLATVQRLIREAGGYVTVNSRPGEGTEFRILLPKIKSDLQPMLVDAPLPPIPGGNERILVVDEDELVCHLLESILKTHGYAVQAATTFDQLAKSAAAGIDLLVLGGINTPSAVDSVRRRFAALASHTPVLFLTSLDAACDSEQAWPKGCAALQKPFTSRDLCQKIRQLLDQA